MPIKHGVYVSEDATVMPNTITGQDAIVVIGSAPIYQMDNFEELLNNPILCRCDSCGMEWKAYPGTLLGGSGCPSCARVRGTAKRTKSAEEFMAQLKSANPTVEMLEKYVNDRTKIKFRCLECGWEWKVSPGSLLRGTKCPSCTKNSTSFFEQSILLGMSIGIAWHYCPWSY
jgi:rubrerythrin